MSKKRTALTLVVISLVGSFVTFYASNMVFSDVGNACQGLHDLYFIGSLPAFFFALDFIVMAIYTVRSYIKPWNTFRIARAGHVVVSLFSLFGIITCIIAGTEVYNSFVKPYPFPGYLVISLAAHTAVLAASGVNAIKNRKNKAIHKEKYISKKEVIHNGEKINDPGVTFIYVIHTIALALLTFFAFNRFGAFLWAGVYVHMRTLYMTFPFYLWLLVPIGILAEAVFYILGFFEKRPKLGLANSIVLFAANLILGSTCFAIGRYSTVFISAVSPALALERLGTMPIDSLVQFFGGLVMSIYMLVVSIRYSKGKKIDFTRTKKN